MKILAVFCLTLLISGCQSVTDPIKQFIPGTYIRFSHHEYGTEQDTLIIAVQNNNADEFRITRKWKYERAYDSTKLQPEYKLATTSGIFDPAHQILKENETGNNYSFDPKANCLYKGHTKYQKL